MSPTSYSDEEIFQLARRIDSVDARRAYLDQTCRDDITLRKEVEALLAAFEASENFLESPASEIPTREQAIHEQPGTVIGPYKLLQQIGEGGMGIVFMAEQTEPIQRTVALKIIKPGMDTRQVIARFEAERQALAMMDHPNIARVLGVGATDAGLPYFVMDLVKGVPITDYCDQQHLPVRERLELMSAVCQAVQHAHHKGIIHRDIKPNNVLVAEYDGKPVPKIIDFGVAKAVASKLTEKTLFTELGQMVGTMEYMSPEQARFNQLDVDTRSDIYSLGVLLYELLTGSTPFVGKRLQEAEFDEMLRIIREEEPPKPSTRLSSSDALPSIAANRSLEPLKLNRLVAGELDWIVMKALEKDRNRRYETPAGLAHDIGHYLADEQVQACPPSTSYRLQKFARRNTAALVTTIIVAASLMLGTAISTWQAVRATRATRQAQAALAREAELRKEAQGRGDIVMALNLCATGDFQQAEKLMSEVPNIFIELDARTAAPVFRELANWNGGEQRWTQAAAYLDAIFFGSARRGQDLKGDPLSMDYLTYAPVLIELGDTARYERLGESARMRLSENKGAAERMLNAFLLRPIDQRQMATFEKWGKMAVPRADANEFVCWHYVALALLEYRQNDPTRAAEWAHKCLENPSPLTCNARAHVILAMAYSKLNRSEQAEAELIQCRDLIQNKFKGHLGRGSYETGFWKDWLIDRILLREAEALIQPLRPHANAPYADH